MARIDTTQADALDAVVLRLQTALSLNERQCYPVARAQGLVRVAVHDLGDDARRGGDHGLAEGLAALRGAAAAATSR